MESGKKVYVLTLLSRSLNITTMALESKDTFFLWCDLGKNFVFQWKTIHGCHVCQKCVQNKNKKETYKQIGKRKTNKEQMNKHTESGLRKFCYLNIECFHRGTSQECHYQNREKNMNVICNVKAFSPTHDHDNVVRTLLEQLLY